MKAAEKIIDALNQLLTGYNQLYLAVRDDLGATASEELDEEIELHAEVDAAVATELRAAVETVIEGEDFSTEEMAAMLSNLSEALEEIDPDVFAAEVEEDEEEDDYSVYDDDDDDIDLDDDLDDLDDDDEEEEDED